MTQLVTFFLIGLSSTGLVKTIYMVETRRKMAEKGNTPLSMLLQREDHPSLHQIMQNINQIVWILDLGTDQIVYVNPAFESVWGHSCESFYANPEILIESIHPEDRVQVMAAASRTDNKPYNQAYRILRPDGKMRWIFARTFLIAEENSGSNFSICIAQDITEQKQLEEKLRSTLDRTREHFELSRKMGLARKPESVLKILMLAHELRSAQRAALIYFENPRLGPAHGVEVTATWLSSQNLSPWLSEANLYDEHIFWKILQSNRTVVISGFQSDPRLTSVICDFLQEGGIQTIAIFPLVSVGVWFGSLLVYYNQEKHFDHIELRHLKVLVSHATISLSNLKLLEEAEESRLEAERANEIKTEFLAMISHELRTPLTSILGFTTTLLADDVTWQPDEQRDFIQTIEKETNRLQELIDHLLVLSRLEAGMLSISMSPHSLHEIIEDALPQLHSLTLGKTLTKNLPDNLPMVQVDAKRIAQVVVNLVRNAAAYAPEKSEISITTNIRGNFMQINVSDQGPGIPAADQKRLFKPFQRGSNVEDASTQGAGLGLAICKGLVEAHGGRIWIRKKPTPGATISFTIPIANEHALLEPEEEVR